MTLLYPLKQLFFFRLTYHEDNFIYQSRGFDGMRYLKTSLTSFTRYMNDNEKIEIYSIQPKTNKLDLVCKGNKEYLKKVLYNK